MPANQVLMRKINNTSIIKLFLQKDIITQAEISKKLGISKVTTLAIINELRKKNFIKEIGSGPSTSAGGRKPKLLQLNEKAGYILSIDIDIYSIRIALLSIYGNIIFFKEYNLKINANPELFFENLHQKIKSFLTEFKINLQNIFGAGVAFPGVVDRETGICLYSAKFNFSNINIAQILKNKLNIPVFMENDVHLHALAEMQFGAGKGYKNIIYFRISGGLSSALIINADLYQGTSFRSGEIGHNTIKENGILCSCGKRGCLQMYVSEQGLSEIIKIKFKEETDFSQISDLISWLFKKAANDKKAKNIIEVAAKTLGIGMANSANTFDPELVLVGGTVINKSNDFFLKTIKESFYKNIFDAKSRNIIFKKSTLGENAGLIGASMLVYRHIYDYAILT